MKTSTIVIASCLFITAILSIIIACEPAPPTPRATTPPAPVTIDAWNAIVVQVPVSSTGNVLVMVAPADRAGQIAMHTVGGGEGTTFGPFHGTVDQPPGQPWAFRYTPQPGYVGKDSIEYVIFDTTKRKPVREGQLVIDVVAPEAAR